MTSASDDAALENWERLKQRIQYVAEAGTTGYRDEDLAGLIVANLTGYLASTSSLSFAISFALHDLDSLRPLVIGNVVSAVCTAATPLFHRFSRCAAAIWLTAVFLVSLYYFTSLLGRESGVILNLIGASAVAFAALGLHRYKFVLGITALSAMMVVYCWARFPNAAEGIYDSPFFLQQIFATSIISIMTIIFVVIYYAFYLAAKAQAQTDALLRSIMPDDIVNRLKNNPGVTIAEKFEAVSVLFADVVSFTELTNQIGPERIVELLDELFRAFDEHASKLGVEKIKTIGDAYMAACGVPTTHPTPETSILAMAISMHEVTHATARKYALPLSLRIGIASGPLTAGVVGKSKYFYDVWGPVVNLASRLQTAACPGQTLVSDNLKVSLQDQFCFIHCGNLELKGFGSVTVWQVGIGESATANRIPK